MFIRVLVIWIACGLWLNSILHSEPSNSQGSSAQASVAAMSGALTAAERKTAMTHLRCVAPVIEGRDLRVLSSANSAASRDYVMAPMRADRQVAGSCGAIVLAAAAR